jgi:AcrR family transcriptional regulator
VSETNESNNGGSFRDRLLDAAERLVAQQGVANLTLEAVAREAGVSKGGLLYHFPSKSNLVLGIVERLVSRVRKQQMDAVASEGQTPGAFTRAYLATRDQPLSPEEASLHGALLAAMGTDPQLLAPVREVSVEWLARLESDGIDPAVAHIVSLVLDGLCFCRLLGLALPDEPMRQRIRERLQSMIVPQERPNA